MPQAIGHFAVGASVALIILIATDWIKKEKINDIFFVFLVGFLAMVPDMPILWGNATIDNQPWADLFVFHRTLDQYIKDDPLSSSILLGIMFIILLIYFKQIKKSKYLIR